MEEKHKTRRQASDSCSCAADLSPLSCCTQESHQSRGGRGEKITLGDKEVREGQRKGGKWITEKAPLVSPDSAQLSEGSGGGTEPVPEHGGGFPLTQNSCESST